MPINSLHSDQVDQSLECFFRSNRNNNRARVCTEHIFQLTHYFKEVCPWAVHFIHITDTRNIIFISLTPYCFGLRLNTTYSTKCSNSSIQYTKRTFYLCSKIHVPRSIDQVYLKFISSIIPPCSSRSRGNRNTSFLLLLHPVHCRCPVMYLTDFMSQSGIEKNTFRSRSLSGIDMCHNTNISGIFQ